MSDAMPASDPFGGPDELATQTARHIRKKYGFADDPMEAARVPIDSDLVGALVGDKLFHQYLRNVTNTDPAVGAFLCRLRRALFFGEWTDDDREEPPLGLIASVARQCMRLDYGLPAEEEEQDWVALLRKELAGADWRNPPLDLQVQLLRLALYKPLKGLPFEMSLMIVRQDHWHEQIGALVHDALRDQLTSM